MLSWKLIRTMMSGKQMGEYPTLLVQANSRVRQVPILVSGKIDQVKIPPE